MTGVTLIGATNYVKSGVVAAAFGATAANMGVGNLQSDQGSPSTAWQTASGTLTAGVQIIPAAPAQTWRAAGVFRTNLTSAAQVNFYLFNGPQPSGSATQVAHLAVSPVNGQAVAIFSADTVADWMQINVTDTGNQDGFINVPLAFAGPAWLPAMGASWQSTHGRDDQVVEATTRGGQEYPTLYWQRRHYALALDGVRGSEVWASLDPLERVARAGGNVLFVPDITSADMQNQAIFGRLKPTADVSYPYQAADRRAWRAQITERL